ncbi:MAG: hypothetical protein NTY35_01790 [Planctomycetota bacterium]|nr:hypothetical protein [Planctomycetota bacterium]
MNAGLSMPIQRARWDMPRLLLRLAILAWAGFWTWFVVLDGLHDAVSLGPTTYLIMLAILAGLWIPTVAAWLRPLAGAVCMALAGALALWFFPGAFARGILAGPPIAFAVALFWIAKRERAHGAEGGPR